VRADVTTAYTTSAACGVTARADAMKAYATSAARDVTARADAMIRVHHIPDVAA
jgi:hypothetical protein